MQIPSGQAASGFFFKLSSAFEMPSVLNPNEALVACVIGMVVDFALPGGVVHEDPGDYKKDKDGGYRLAVAQATPTVLILFVVSRVLMHDTPRQGKIHHHPNDAGDMRLVRLDHGRHLERRAQLEEEVACGLPRRDMHAIGTPHIITGLPKEEPEGLALARPDTRISFPTQRSSAAVPHVRNWFRTALSAPACG